MNNYFTKPGILCLIAVSVQILTTHACFGLPVPEDAKRHNDRGNAAVETAKTPADYEHAIAEFEKAKALAPAWADVYYNLALTQELAEKYGDAATSLKQYLRLAPGVDNTEEIKSHINKLEYRLERTAKQEQVAALLEGEWVGFVTFNAGVRRELRFYNLGKGQVSVELPVTYLVDQYVYTDYQRIKVKINEESVSFKFRAKTVLKSISQTLYADVNIELKVVDSNTLEGLLFQDGEKSDQKLVFSKVVKRPDAVESTWNSKNPGKKGW